MAICKLTITTSVDGVSNQTHRMGKIEISESEIVLSYREENARVCVALVGKSALVEREGDYLLRLPLEEGKVREGFLGVGGSEGEISVRTDSVEYAVEGSAFRASLRYGLLFGDETQEMRLEIRALTAKGKGEV